MARLADPSTVIAAELAFNRLAQEEGQWAAFRKMADKDAIMFVPQAVNAQGWLRSRPEPEARLLWWPSRVFISCDGSYAASTGSWERSDGTVGYFTTIWRRQKKGNYLWVIDQGDTAPSLRAAREDDLEAKVAQCARGPRRDDGPAVPRGKPGKPPKLEIVRIADPPPAAGDGQSDDGTLRWRWTVRSDGSRIFTVTMRQDDEDRTVIEDEVKAVSS